MVARRYAKALLAIGKEDGKYQEYGIQLKGFVELLEKNPDLKEVLITPLYKREEREEVLKLVLKKLDLSPAINNFLLLVTKKGRLGAIRDIADYYQVLLDELMNIKRAKITTATQLDNKTLNKIKDALQKRTGAEIKIDVKIDPSIIGGIITQIGDLIIDGSIKTQLLSLKESLKRGG